MPNKFLRQDQRTKEKKENPYGLTDKQLTVAILYYNGKSLRGISNKLKLHVTTVKEHLEYTYKKMNITNEDQFRAKLKPHLNRMKRETRGKISLKCRICNDPAIKHYCKPCQFAIDNFDTAKGQQITFPEGTTANA